MIANREIFGRLNTAAMLPRVERAVAEHGSEIVLHEATEYAGPITAIRAAIRHAQVAISLAAVEHGSLAIAAPALERHGPVLDALRAAPYLSRFPAAIDPSPYRDTRRYREPLPVSRALPDWWGGSTEPLVYVTFGTVAGAVGTGAYRVAAEALASLPVRVLMTTGQELDLGAMPSRIHVRRWVDQHDALAEASAVVCHGGSGTTLGALAAGVPMVIVAMFQIRRATHARSKASASLLASLPAASTPPSGRRTARAPSKLCALRSSGSCKTDCRKQLRRTSPSNWVSGPRPRLYSHTCWLSDQVPPADRSLIGRHVHSVERSGNGAPRSEHTPHGLGAAVALRREVTPYRRGLTG